ncbi:T9SS-dependent choice-of-anchor J family protein [Flavobacterium sp. MK4S-17]|uniref:T9SS-dependent choice-of-anchor J family protein n=1 Tax=Flavobacterium sp. MK4S-17 TaxID=2543737 RepID=UPI00135B093D|nr:choice-of-anchor J domain-containing protein [Flavobacterium sp. MK4S-17]
MKKITFLLAILFGITAQAQLPEDFEGAVFPPAGWAVYAGTNGEGPENSWGVTEEAYNGTGAAYIEYEAASDGTVAEDWLVTPLVTISASASSLSFYQSQSYGSEYGSEYTVRISTTSQTDHASFTVVDLQSESDFSNTYSQKIVDLSAYAGQSVYIAFVMSNNDGDDWFIDDVEMIDTSSLVLPTCASNPTPTDMATNIPVGDVVFAWDAPTTGSEPITYDLYYGLEPGEATNLIGNFETTSADIDLSGYSTTFYWKIVPRNTLGQAVGCVEWSFTTEAEPVVAPDYTNDFVEFPGEGWTTASGTLAEGPVYAGNYWSADAFGNDETSGSESAVVNIYEGFPLFGSPATSDWLLSPLFNLTAGTYYINFDAALTGYNVTTPASFGPDDFVALLYTADNGTNWTEITRWDATNPVTAGAVPEIAFSQTGNVKFAFYAETVEASGTDVEFFIDNFSLTQSSLSVANNNLENFAYYPNPVKNILNLSYTSDIEGVEIYNLLGQTVLQKELNTSNAQVDLSTLAAGNYFAKVKVGNAVKTIKIVKQ